MDYVKLNNDVEMPVLGMGTFPLNGFSFARLIRKAVKLGYSSFDLAKAYGNEKWFGRGLKFCGKKRKECFITSKLSNSCQRKKDVRTAFQKSLKRLGLDYLDMYLIHWPVPNLYVSSWKEMEALYKEGLVRAIGVCNFHEHHLRNLLDNADILPVVNQVELHPLLSQQSLTSFCRRNGIQIEAYSPLARMHEKLIKDQVLVSIAKQYSKTIPQIILRWNLQRGIVAIPKTSDPIRMKENISIFDFVLSEKEMGEIDLLNADFRVRHDPDNCDFNKL